MICPHCGAENDNQEDLCAVCGKPLSATIEEAPASQAAPLPAPRFPKWAIALVFVMLVVLGVGAYFVLPGLNQPAEKPLLFSVVTNNPQGMAIFTADHQLKNQQQVVLNDSGLILPYCGYYGDEKSFLSPDGKYIVMASGTEMNRLALYSVSNRSKVELSEMSVPPYGLPIQGFSSRGKYFGFSTIEGDTQKSSVRIVEMNGKLVQDIPDAIFGSFSPDESKIVVLRYDANEINVNGFDLVQLSTGKRTPLIDVNFAGDMEVALFSHPFFSPDGKEIYYVNLNQLYRIPISGGKPTSIYEFGGGSGIAYVSPNQDNLVLVDMVDTTPSSVLEKSVLANVSLFHLKTGTITSIAEKIIYSMASKDLPVLCEQAFRLSPDQKQIAYNALGEETGKLVLSALDGSKTDSLTDGMEQSLEFTPNSRSLVYISRSKPYGINVLYGDLFASHLDGDSLIPIDNKVWTFKLVNGGKEILYVKVNLLDTQDFTSDIYKINIDGTGKTLVLEAKEGIYTFLKD